MTHNEVKQKVDSWIGGFESFSVREVDAANRHNGQGRDHWDEHMLEEAEKLDITKELTGSPVEQELRSAISLAKQHDIFQLPSIYLCLLRVKQYLDILPQR